MALRRRQVEANYWPGFVDAMATLLLVIVFLLSIFIIAQVFLSRQISGRDSILNELRTQISDLTQSLALEKSETRDLESQLDVLTATLAAAENSKKDLAQDLASASENAGSGVRITGLEQQLDAQKQLSEEAQGQVNLLNQQIAALRRQLASLEAVLDESESRDKESQAKILDLGSRLNAALAQRVRQLNQYRSDFFGRLREILATRDDIRIVGDRFVFQSELLFQQGQAEVSQAGRGELQKLAQAILEIASQIPEEINWVIRVDGHTDNRPINTVRFPSNWELSAARAIAVSRVMLDFGVPPERLLAAGFGEFQPLSQDNTPEALARNRRIEFKLTER